MKVNNMHQETKLIDLYSQNILALAANIPLLENLRNPQIVVKKRSALCGSMITIQLIIKDNRISEFAQDVRACALGQASASIVGNSIIGAEVHDIIKLRNQVSEMLKNNGDVPTCPFNDFKYLTPAKEYKNRHASILLILDASVEGIERLNSSKS